MATYLLSRMLNFTLDSIKPIEKLSRRHFINSFNVFDILGLTVVLKLIITNQVQTFPNCGLPFLSIQYYRRREYRLFQVLINKLKTEENFPVILTY